MAYSKEFIVRMISITLIWVFFNAEKYLYLCFLSDLFTFLHEVDQKLCDGVSYDWKITLSRIDHCQNYELHKNVQCLQLVFVRMKLIKKWIIWFDGLWRGHVITYSLLNVFEHTFSIITRPWWYKVLVNYYWLI